MRSKALYCVACLTLTQPAAGQQTPARAPVGNAPASRLRPPPGDTASVVAAAQHLFDAMATRDTAALRALLVPGARFSSRVIDPGADHAPRAQSDTAFIARIGTGREGLLERMWEPRIDLRDSVATLSAPYDFHVDGKFSHCGIDVFTLRRAPNGWRIAGIEYTIQRTGCAPSPLGPARGATGRPEHRMTSPAVDTGHAPVNGISMYYEQHGRREGVPLVLLHGGGSTIDVTYGRVLPIFAASRRVLAVEEQGHGRTTDRAAPVAFESSADDVAALLRHLKIDRADVMGFSNGASVALQMAIRHPQLVRRLVFASSFTKRAGAQPQLWEIMSRADFSNMPQPLKDAYLRVNPDPAKLRTMHDKDAARMRSFADVPDALVRSVRAPTLIVLGDRDIVRPEHGLELTRLIPDSRLLVLPGGHGDYLGELVMTQRESVYPELTARLIMEFLDFE